jgi:hypothetical protein
MANIGILEQYHQYIYLQRGAQSISQDGKYLFFTGCNRPMV